MASRMVRTRNVVAVVVVAIGAVGIVLALWLTRGRVPETEEIARAISPDGTWTAKVEMVVYGDHHFVNDARYEVRIGHVGNQDKEVFVYSAQASGPIGIAIKWQTNEKLVIEDAASVLPGAIKQPHPVINIEYRPI